MIALIPARGGSKGIPNKNIIDLNGKPLIYYTINEAKKAKEITKIIVSTDSPEIAKIAISFGAEVPFLRPPNLSQDNSLAIDNYKYTIERLENLYHHPINEFCVLQPTSPLRNHNDISNSIKLFIAKHADSVISFTNESHPIFWHKYLSENNEIIEIFEESRLSNRQDLRPTYFPNGAVYVFRKKLIYEGRYYSSNSYAYVMPRNRSIDIDNYCDLDYADFLIKRNKNEILETFNL